MASLYPVAKDTLRLNLDISDEAEQKLFRKRFFEHLDMSRDTCEDSHRLTAT